MVLNLGSKHICTVLHLPLSCSDLSQVLPKLSLPCYFTDAHYCRVISLPEIYASADGLGRERKRLFYTALYNAVSGCHHFLHICPSQFPVLDQFSFHELPNSHFCWFGWALLVISFNFAAWMSPSFYHLEKNLSSLRERSDV